ncbi:MAG: hypothetical protein IJY71_04745 [Clostridia bacterium]|nr:hypothetical protein [Clostridia bacterium]
MKLSTKKLHLIALIVALAFALLLTVARTVLVLTAYDPLLGHFAPGFFADYGFALLGAVAVIAFLFFVIMTRESTPAVSLATAPFQMLASAFVAIASFAWLLDTALSLMGKTATTAETVLLILTLLFAVGVIVYMASTVLSATSLTLTAGAAMATALFSIFYAMLAYFNTAFTLNSPIKILDQVTFLALLLFFLAESRLRLGKRGRAFYLFAAMTALVLTAANSLPGLIYFAAKQSPLVGSFMHDFLVLAFFLYVLSRLLPMLLQAEQSEEHRPKAVLTDEDKAPLPRPDNPMYDTSAEATIDFDRKRR